MFHAGKKRSSQKRLAYISPYVILLTGCGSEGEPTIGTDENQPADPTPTRKEGVDIKSGPVSMSLPYKNLYYTQNPEPYWRDALEMENSQALIDYVAETGQTLYYHFPDNMPEYLSEDMDQVGWKKVPNQVKFATKEILEKLEVTLDVKFREVSNPDAPFVISVMSNEQSDTDGYGYLPSAVYPIGSDIFISRLLVNPTMMYDERTNYDYEVLVHEIGHALGLVHPFELNSHNTEGLSNREENSKYTAMSYSLEDENFTGDFRPLDYLSLVGIYGLNPNINSSNDTYTFDETEGRFIFDGGGIDLIDATASPLNAFINLREEGISYLGTSDKLASSPNHLTISKYSDIENVITGSGNDYVMGNNLANEINTGAGNDVIYAAGGADVIFPGGGRNFINLTEEESYHDTVVLNLDDETQYSEIYGFQQNGTYDILAFIGMSNTDYKISPVVDRVTSSEFLRYDVVLTKSIAPSDWLFEVEALSPNGGFGSSKIIIHEDETGLGQAVHHVQAGLTGGASHSHVATLFNTGLALEHWTPENFSSQSFDLV